MPLTFGYLLDAEAQEQIKAKTSEVFNKSSPQAAKACAASSSSKAKAKKQAEVAGTPTEVSDMFK